MTTHNSVDRDESKAQIVFMYVEVQWPRNDLQQRSFILDMEVPPTLNHDTPEQYRNVATRQICDANIEGLWYRADDGHMAVIMPGSIIRADIYIPQSLFAKPKGKSKPRGQKEAIK